MCYMMTMIMTVISKTQCGLVIMKSRKESVDIMIRGSQDVIHDLIGYGVDLQRKMVNFCTQEKAPIPDLEFCFMKILLVKKSQVSFLHR